MGVIRSALRRAGKAVSIVNLRARLLNARYLDTRWMNSRLYVNMHGRAPSFMSLTSLAKLS